MKGYCKINFSNVQNRETVIHFWPGKSFITLKEVIYAYAILLDFIVLFEK